MSLIEGWLTTFSMLRNISSVRASIAAIAGYMTGKELTFSSRFFSFFLLSAFANSPNESVSSTRLFWLSSSCGQLQLLLDADATDFTSVVASRGPSLVFS